MQYDEIINELYLIRNEMSNINHMLNIIVGDIAIDRSMKSGIIDEIINFLKCIEENTNKINIDELKDIRNEMPDINHMLNIIVGYLNRIEGNTNKISRDR